MYVNDITIKHGSMGYRGDQTLISHVLETGSSGNAIFKTKNPERTPPPPVLQNNSFKTAIASLHI